MKLLRRAVGWIEKNNKRKISFCFISLVLMVCVYYPSMSFLKTTKKYEIISQKEAVIDYNVLMSIDKLDKDENGLNLSGWTMLSDATYADIYLILKSMDDEKETIFPVEKIDRNDIFYADYKNEAYDATGFFVQISNEAQEENLCYEIYFALEYFYGNRGVKESNQLDLKKVISGKYLYNGEIYNYNPNGFTPPDIVDEELREVITKGTIRHYDNEEKLWIYHYKNELYFILNSRFGSMADAKIGFPVMPRTFQVDLLPEERKQYGFDHIGFFYENVEYQRIGILPYLVVKVSLPKDYKVTYVSTGLYDDIQSKWVKAINIPMVD